MLLLTDLLTRLNAAIDEWNRRVDARVLSGRLDAGSAAALKVRPGMATAELVSAERWPDSFVQAAKSSHVQENSQTIVELAKFVKHPTPTIQQMRYGCEQTTGRVVVRTLDLAHLLARSAV